MKFLLKVINYSVVYLSAREGQMFLNSKEKMFGFRNFYKTIFRTISWIKYLILNRICSLDFYLGLKISNGFNILIINKHKKFNSITLLWVSGLSSLLLILMRTIILCNPLNFNIILAHIVTHLQLFLYFYCYNDCETKRGMH